MSATPCSVTMWSTVFFMVVTMEPGVSVARMRETVPPAAVDGSTRATFRSAYDSAEALAKVLEMGMEEGATLAINQIDAFLAS